MIRTKLTERYGIELPFVSAGMGFIAVPSLAAAVSNAGGLGQLANGAGPPEILRELINSTRALTGRPFAVNFIIETTAFGPLATDAHLRVCIEERVPAVVFHWAPPPAEWVRMLKDAGCDVGCRPVRSQPPRQPPPPAWISSLHKEPKRAGTLGARQVYSPCCRAWSML